MYSKPTQIISVVAYLVFVDVNIDFVPNAGMTARNGKKKCVYICCLSQQPVMENNDLICCKREFYFYHRQRVDKILFCVSKKWQQDILNPIHAHVPTNILYFFFKYTRSFTKYLLAFYNIKVIVALMFLGHTRWWKRLSLF